MTDEEILLALLYLILLIVSAYAIFWAIGVFFEIFGYHLTFWQKLAVFILLLVIMPPFRRGGD